MARAPGVLGELALRRRAGRDGSAPVYELMSNGVFLMDSEDATSERLLAERVLRHLEGEALRVLVGGLGLGFTAAAVLADPRVAQLLVVEIEPQLTTWLRAGLVPSAPDLDDRRLTILHGDVAEVVLLQPEASLDAVLLDVDNGPGFLTHPANAGLYGDEWLQRAASRLRPGGAVAVWSADPSPALAESLAHAVGPVEEQRIVVHRAGRRLEYLLYLARRP
ncbi:MAG: spermidine synthase [Actinomycetes bacterium]